jgi:hypothetical protein
MAMGDPTILTLKRIQRAAEAILPAEDSRIGADDGIELANAYVRWRNELATVVRNADWDLEAFERQVPPFSLHVCPAEPRKRYDMATSGRRAAPLLRALVGWTRGAVEVVEAEEAAPRRPPEGEDVRRFR